MIGNLSDPAMRHLIPKAFIFIFVYSTSVGPGVGGFEALILTFHSLHIHKSLEAKESDKTVSR